jgi:3-oxoacyl-[acyl-carrier protein] reductase
VTAVPGDVSLVKTWYAALDTALATYGRLDIVVNNAGVVQKATPSHEVDEEEFDRLIRINVKPLFHSCKVIMPHFMAQKSGCFINLCSTSAPRPRPGIVWSVLPNSPYLPLPPSHPTNPPSPFYRYGTSKGAVQTTTKGLAVEYAKHGIRVNAISPALGETAMLGLVMGKPDTPENRAPLLASIPMGRFAQVTDVANVACFLASEEASYMTGSCVEVDGGRCI